MATQQFDDLPSVTAAKPGARSAARPPLPKPAERALTFGLLLSAVRCSIQYVVVPFILPWVGVTAAVPPWLTLGLGLLALAALARNVRYLWRVRHARRWSYVLVAVVIAITLVVFVAVDVNALLKL